MGFRSSILAGTRLVREAIQSSNYDPGVSGWTVNRDGSAEFADLQVRSSDGSGTTVLIANGEITVLDGSGATVVELDSSGYRLYTPSGQLVAEIKLDGGGAIGGFYTRNFAFPENVYAYLSGGELSSGPVDISAADLHGFLQYVMTPSASAPYAVQTLSTGAIDYTQDDEARLQLVSERGQRPVVWVDGGSSAVEADLIVTGDSKSGGAVIGDTLNIADTNFSDYVPVMTGGGSAVYTSDGWSYKFGKLRYVHAFVQCTAAGSGTTGITISLPSVPYRSGHRQYLTVYAGGIAAGTNSATGGTAIGNINFTGSGDQIDQIRSSTDVQYRGANLGATTTFTVDGWYREA